MLFVRPELHDITGTDFLDRSALALHAASASRDDKRLTYRMRMPGRPAPGSNVTVAAAARDGAFAENSGSMRTAPVNQSAGPLLEGCDPTRVIFMA